VKGLSGVWQDKRIGLQIVKKNKITKNFNRKVEKIEEGRGKKDIQTKNLFDLFDFAVGFFLNSCDIAGISGKKIPMRLSWGFGVWGIGYRV
jgi:hypothetical protein